MKCSRPTFAMDSWNLVAHSYIASKQNLRLLESCCESRNAIDPYIDCISLKELTYSLRNSARSSSNLLFKSMKAHYHVFDSELEGPHGSSLELWLRVKSFQSCRCQTNFLRAFHDLRPNKLFQNFLLLCNVYTSALKELDEKNVKKKFITFQILSQFILFKR